MAIWVEGAPHIGHDSDETVLQFIQQYITCRLPGKDREPVLYDLVQRYQFHRYCNSYCLRKWHCGGRFYTACRFGFPRNATDSAILHNPLRTCQQRSMGQMKSRLYQLRRTAAETRINDYNAELLLLWKGNCDVQFLSEDTTAVVNYIVMYITKHEQSGLQKLWKEVENDPVLSKSIFKFAVRCLSNREVGAYEAADCVVGQELYGKSRQTVFICAQKPHLCPRVLKTLKSLREIAAQASNSTRKYENDWISTYYPDRPDELEDVCLYDFRRCYDRLSTVSDDSPLPFKTVANGSLVLRNKPYLVSHPIYKFADNREDYCYSLLLLF